MTRAEYEKLLQEDKGLRETLEIGLSEQWKFSAEPVLARTGKGFLRSAGIEEMAKIKEDSKKGVGRGAKPT